MAVFVLNPALSMFIMLDGTFELLLQLEKVITCIKKEKRVILKPTHSLFHPELKIREYFLKVSSSRILNVKIQVFGSRI